jgi:L-ascorbate metabolism protein UlaG (beta-lactamase superfamily)
MIIAVIVLLIIVSLLYFYLQQPKFGKAPAGKRLQQMMQSPHYRNGKFHNLHKTPQLTEGYTIPKVLYEFLFKKVQGKVPAHEIPVEKTDIRNLPLEKDVLIWFGHSSYYLQVDKKRMLVDPVLSGKASPINGLNKAFKGTDPYTVDDLPVIDYLFITHDHYDHFDYETIIQLKNKVKKVICSLGVGAHLEAWGYPEEMIIEKDWNEAFELEEGFRVITKPARHFSGRLFNRNSTLWLSYLLITPSMKLYLGGDSGYDTHFKEIGDQYGPIDLAILENGQYDIKWKYIHMNPAEVLEAGKDLKAKRVFPVHSGKFAMANHTWDEPLQKVTELNIIHHLQLVTPMIGEPVYLKDENQLFSEWWKTI